MTGSTTTLSRRRLIGLAAAGGVTAAASGCGLGGSPSRPETGSGGGKDLVVWFPGTNQAEMKLVKSSIVPRFEKESGARVQVTYLDYADLSTKLNAAFAAGTAPDVFGHGPAAVADFVSNGRIADLGSYLERLSATDRKDLAAGLPGGQVGGKQYMIPLSMQGLLVACDADEVAKAGLDPSDPPENWDGVLETARRLTRRSGDRITHSGLILPSDPIGLQQSFAVLIAAAGGAQMTPDGTRPSFDSAAGKLALQTIVDAYNGSSAVASGLGTNYASVAPAQLPIVTGSASMMLSTPTAVLQMQQSAPKRKLAVLPALPLGSSGKAASFGGPGPGLMINADSAEKDLGWRFISYLLEPDVAAEYTQGISAVPVRASAADSAYVRGSTIIQTFLAMARNWVPNPNIPAWVQVRDTMSKDFEQATNQRAGVEAALSRAAQDVQSVLSKSR